MANRSNTPFVLGLLAIGAVVPAGWFLFMREPPPPPVAPVVAVLARDAGPHVVDVRLAQLSGTVQVRKGSSADAGWLDAKPGDVISPADAIRTADGSWAVMVGEEFWEVRMEAGTEIEMGELSASISQLLLTTGMAHATVKGNGRHTFEVRSTTGDAAARTDGGTFTVASNGKGTIAVGTQAGEVSFIGKGRVVIVRAGQESIIRPGQGPSEPATVPSSLLLKVGLPPKTTVNTPRIVLRGDAPPGSLVEVQGRVVEADEKGHFESKVTLREGKNALEVRARGVGGATSTSQHRIELDTTVKATLDKVKW